MLRLPLHVYDENGSGFTKVMEKAALERGYAVYFDEGVLPHAPVQACMLTKQSLSRTALVMSFDMIRYLACRHKPNTL